MTLGFGPIVVVIALFPIGPVPFPFVLTVKVMLLPAPRAINGSAWSVVKFHTPGRNWVELVSLPLAKATVGPM